MKSRVWSLREWEDFALMVLQHNKSDAHCYQAGFMCWMDEQSGGAVSIWQASKLLSN